jgi:UDP-glucose:(heptosyl)LPS alpha-1,3-glucosyltransferase
MLPPGIDPSRKRPDDWQQQRQQLREQFSIQHDEFLLLMVGTGFKTKGVDRSIAALANLPAKLKNKTRLFIIGEGDATPYEKQAKQAKVSDRVEFFGGRGDIPQFLLAADLLVHPARKENTGTVILEAMVAGLPVLLTYVCGYASHVSRSGSGLLIASPFKQDEFDLKLITMLSRERLANWSDNAINYAQTEDLYSMPEKAAAIISTMLDAN